MGRQARADAAGDELDERRVREDQPVAEALIPRLPVVLPERLGVGCRHDEENTPRRGRFLSPVAGARSWRELPIHSASTAAAIAMTMARPPCSAEKTAINARATASTEKRAPSARRCTR